MDKMNLFNVLTVSVPEFAFDIFIGLLLIGERSKLILIKTEYLLRFISTIALMSLTTILLRMFSPNINYNLLASIMVYILIWKICLGLKIYKAVIGVIMSVAFLVTIELAYIFPVMGIIDQTFVTIFDNNIIRILYSIPERLIQILVIIALWNINSILVNLNKYKKIRTIGTITIILLMVSESFIALIFVNNFNEISFAMKCISVLSLFILVALNFLVFKLITIVTKTIRLELEETIANYKSNIIDTVSIINKFIKKDDKENKKIS